MSLLYVFMMGVMGVSMMNTPNNPKIKEKFPNLIKGIIENIKVNIIPYKITKKTGRLSSSIHCPNGGHGIKPGKEIITEYSLEGLMLKLKLKYFGHLMQRAD